VKALMLMSLALGVLATVAGPVVVQPTSMVTKFAAHRGGSLLWPENSLLAFRRAAETLGADFLEFDVHLSKDDQVVVIHDPTLERTTNGRGPVRALTLAELQGRRLRDRNGALTDEPVPSLDDVVALAMRTRRQMLLEIKVDDRERRYPGIEERVFEVLDRHQAVGATVVMSFERDTWKRVRALRPDVRTCALYSRRTIGDLGSTLRAEVEQAQRAGVAMLGLHQNLVDADTVALARQVGMTLGVWTVNDASGIRRFIGLGVDLVITDRPDLAKTVLGR
jgi:glycerophosphoryl diester phosphodiesterase